MRSWTLLSTAGLGLIFDILQISGKANEYIDQKKPWSLLKTNINEAHNALYNITETIRCIGSDGLV